MRCKPAFVITVAVLLHASVSALASGFTVSEDKTAINSNGVVWLSTRELPASVAGIPEGIALNPEVFDLLVLSPDSTHAAVVVIGSNHEWVAVLKLVDRRVIAGHLLYGGGVRKIVWSPDGQKLLIDADEASGLRGVIVVFLSPARPPVRVNALLSVEAKRQVHVSNPEWGKMGQSLTFTVVDAPGTPGKRYQLGDDFSSLSVVGTEEVDQ